MLVSNSAPYSIPLNTAHVPTEAVETQNRFAERIPESKQASDGTRNKGADSEQHLSDADQAAKNTENQGRIIGDKGEDTEQQSQQKDDPKTTEEGQTSSDLQNRQESQQEAADQALIRELAATDRRVKAHEQAHSSVGGIHAGSASFSYKTGPNGVRYAVAGEVPIDLSAVPGNPQATLAKAEQVSRAALAPADPSSTDRRVASAAQALASKARFEIARMAAEKFKSDRGEVQAKINGEEIEEENTFEPTTSFTGGKLRAALATDATEQVGGQVSASA